MDRNFRITFLMGFFLFALQTAVANANLINLEFRPAAQTVTVGSNFSIDLYAVSDNGGSLSISDIDAIVNWNPGLLQLTGLVNSSPYSWLSSNFPNDSGLDGLNAPFGPLPANDGDALYRAQRNFSNPAFATPGGLLVTTFTLKALAQTPSTFFCIPPSAGNFTQSYVIDGFTAGLEVTGTLGCAQIQVVPEPTAFLLLGSSTIILRRRSR